MTIETTSYEPIVYYVDPAGEYTFTFPIAEADSLEVWEIAPDGSRSQVPANDYSVDFGPVNERYSIRYGGTVIYEKPSNSAVLISIERNTLIAQLVDMPSRSSFNIRMVEFACDKATLIFQELAHRKCDAAATTEMNQLVVITAYDEFRAQTLNEMLNKLFTIAQEIDGSAENCRNRPEDT